MSQHEYSYYGFGISTWHLDQCTMEGVRALAKMCGSDLQEQIADIETVDVLQTEEFDTLESGVVDGVAGIFLEAIRIKENIRLQFYYGDDESIIVFEPLFPWDMGCLTEEEKALTVESLDKILTKYQKVLGIPEEYISTTCYRAVYGYC